MRSFVWELSFQDMNGNELALIRSCGGLLHHKCELNIKGKLCGYIKAHWIGSRYHIYDRLGNEILLYKKRLFLKYRYELVNNEGRRIAKIWCPWRLFFKEARAYIQKIVLYDDEFSGGIYGDFLNFDTNVQGMTEDLTRNYNYVFILASVVGIWLFRCLL